MNIRQFQHWLMILAVSVLLMLAAAWLTGYRDPCIAQGGTPVFIKAVKVCVKDGVILSVR